MVSRGSTDLIDEKIITALQENARMPYTEIARRAGVSEATARKRLGRLVRDNIIEIVAIRNPEKFGMGICGNLKLTIDHKKVDHVVSELGKLDEIWYIALTTGGTDLDLEFNVGSLDELRSLLFDKVNTIDGVVRTETALVLKRYIKKTRYDYDMEALDQVAQGS